MTINRSLITPLVADAVFGLLESPLSGDSTPPLPSLSLSILSASVAENAGSTTGTVTRPADQTTGILTVTLLSSDTSEATVPATVDIADGQQSADFTITILNENLADGDQVATISASATDYNGGSADVTVTDVGVTTALNTNPDFDDGPTGWFLDNAMGGFSGAGDLTVSGGELTIACTSGTAVWLMSEPVSVTSGQDYTVTFVLEAASGGYYEVSWWDTVNTTSFLPTSLQAGMSGPFPQTVSFTITPGATQIRIGGQVNIGASMTFSQIKIEAV